MDYRVRTQHKLEPRWDEGIFLGVRMSTTEKIIGTPKGVVVVQSVRRKPEGSRWSSAAIDTVQGTPWAPSPARERAPRDALELPEPVAIEPERPEVEAVPVHITKECIFAKTILTSMVTPPVARHVPISGLVWIVKECQIRRSVGHELSRDCKRPREVSRELTLRKSV